MKFLPSAVFFTVYLTVSYCQAQNISSASAISLPKVAGTTYTVETASKAVIMSGQSITLLPGSVLQSGSDALLRINADGQGPRLPFVFAQPSAKVNIDYSPWINDDFNDKVIIPDANVLDAYSDVVLHFQGKALVTKLSLFDDLGSMANPAQIYAINGTERTLLGTFNGSGNFVFTDYKFSPGIVADAIVIHKYGDNIPTKVQAYGQLINAEASSSLVLNLLSKKDLPCLSIPNGSVEVAASGGYSPYKPLFEGESSTRGNKVYQYSIDGVNYQKTGLFNSLSAGNHTIYVKDAFSFESQLAVNLTQPAPFLAEYLVSTVVNVGDTVHLIDITKAAHTVENWALPLNTREIATNTNKTITQVVFDAAGTHTVNMIVGHGEGCQTVVSKSITVFPKTAKQEANNALGYKEELLKSIKIFPNPTTGQFTVAIDLSETQNVKLRLHGFYYNELIDIKEETGKSYYEVPFNQPGINPGIYFLTVETGTIVKTLKLIKI
ncbi:MAG: T9SS type A sorting domain-containing protein [Sphingobacteriaceae bacterium]|nr:T9SS type A sorting domain-containing protein [Sphingobacteriaceae bacterium]